MHRHLTVQPRTVATAAASVALISAVAHHKDRLAQFRPQLNSTVIEAISGAAGEVAQIALLYPLDTVKVRCQVAGVGTWKAVGDLWTLTQGNTAAFLAALYAGALPAALLSVLVGAVHYSCFCTTRRAFANIEAAHSSSGSSSSKQRQHRASGEVSPEPAQHVLVSHGATGTHFLPLDESSCDPEQDDQQQQQQQQGASAADKAHSVAAAAAAASTEEDPESVQIANSSMFVNGCAAVVTAALTALVESPLELFRHNSQAGQIQGNFLLEMIKVVRKSGPSSLYHSFIPYCLESWPYDISELVVVGYSKDWRRHPALQHMSSTAHDLTFGALAGAVAVLVSMPFDVIKTYIQTHGPLGSAAAAAAAAAPGAAAVGGGAASSIAGSAGQFLSTGRALVARGGPGALFVGLGPRLAHQVPGAMVCWWVIESCHRNLTEHCGRRAKAGPQPQDGQ